MAERFLPILEWYERNAGHSSPPLVKCPDYWECGDYATHARAGHKPGKVAVRCEYHARRIEEKEAQEEAKA